MNHFFALTLSDDVRRSVAAFAEDWQALLGDAFAARWYAPEDFHVTLKFLGDVRDAKIAPLRAVGSRAAVESSPFSVSVGLSGAFPSPRQPRVLILRLRRSDEIVSLAERLDTLTTALDFPPEMRSYQPHVTLARCQPAHYKRGLEVSLSLEQTFPIFTADHFILMQTLPPGERQNWRNSRYNIVHTFPFGG